MSEFEYEKGPFNYPPEKPSSELVKLFTVFVNNNLTKYDKSTNRDEIKKGYILQLFVGAFPELTNLNEGTKNGLIAGYNKMTELDRFLYEVVSGGSKKKKQVHKKKSKKSKKLN